LNGVVNTNYIKSAKSIVMTSA